METSNAQVQLLWNWPEKLRRNEIGFNQIKESANRDTHDLIAPD